MVAFAQSFAERNAIIEQNLGLAYAAARRFSRARPAAAAALGEQEDIEQIALQALTEAADRFDSSIASFSTYATLCIGFVLSRAVRNAGMIRVPAYIVGVEREELLARLACESLSRLDDDIDPTAPVPADPDTDDCLAAVLDAMRHLTARQRFILRQRSEGVTLGEIGQQLGLAKERVRQIRNEAIARLRSILGISASGSIVRPDRKTAKG